MAADEALEGMGTGWKDGMGPNGGGDEVEARCMKSASVDHMVGAIKKTVKLATCIISKVKVNVNLHK